MSPKEYRDQIDEIYTMIDELYFEMDQEGVDPDVLADVADAVNAVDTAKDSVHSMK